MTKTIIAKGNEKGVVVATTTFVLKDMPTSDSARAYDMRDGWRAVGFEPGDFYIIDDGIFVINAIAIGGKYNSYKVHATDDEAVTMCLNNPGGFATWLRSESERIAWLEQHDLCSVVLLKP